MSVSRFIAAFRVLFRRLMLDTAGGSSPPGPSFLPCQVDREEHTTVTIAPTGAPRSIQLGGHVLEVPEGALDGPVEFTMALVPARMLKVRIRANGQESFAFRAPATLTLSYAQCGPPPSPRELRLYKIDQNDQVQQDLGGSVDEQQRTVTSSLGGLSVYTLGVP